MGRRRNHGQGIVGERVELVSSSSIGTCKARSYDDELWLTTKQNRTYLIMAVLLSILFMPPPPAATIQHFGTIELDRWYVFACVVSSVTEGNRFS